MQKSSIVIRNLFMEAGSHNANGEPHAPPRCLRLHADDNVAVALDEIVPGPVSVMGGNVAANVAAVEAVARGHKMALRAMNRGDSVLKYGVVIGYATEPIVAGGWVHTHNCRSGIDERSHTLDRHTGAPTDTQYV